MNINKELLTTRISILMGRENYTFLTSTESYQSKLYDYFKVRYTSNEIIEALHELEEAYMLHEYEKEKHIVETEEDFI